MAQGKKYAPAINLKGFYLKEYGFEVGDMVKVELSQNRIVISKNERTNTLQDMERKNPALIKLLERLDMEII